MEPVIGSQIARARRRLWTVTFTILGTFGVVLVYVSSADVAGFPGLSFLPSRRVLAVGLLGSLFVFCLYVIDAERKMKQLAERLMAERMETARLSAEQADQRDFVSMAAHELRTPLTAVKGFTRTLMARFDELDPTRRREYLSLVNEQSNRLSRLIDDLMEVTRIDAGRVRLALAPVDLVTLTWEIVDQFHAKWGSRVEIRAAGVVRPALADAHKAEEILINLVDNAIKYSPPDSPVIVTIASGDDAVEVTVADRGPGMSSDDIAGLFTKFHRLPQAMHDDIPGTGLGLYIVRGLVEAHGGRVWVESEPGAGSTFTFRLPAGEPQGAAAQAS